MLRAAAPDRLTGSPDRARQSFTTAERQLGAGEIEAGDAGVVPASGRADTLVAWMLPAFAVVGALLLLGMDVLLDRLA